MMARFHRPYLLLWLFWAFAWLAAASFKWVDGLEDFSNYVFVVITPPLFVYAVVFGIPWAVRGINSAPTKKAQKGPTKNQ